jgi:hypothetical protein
MVRLSKCVIRHRNRTRAVPERGVVCQVEARPGAAWRGWARSGEAGPGKGTNGAFLKKGFASMKNHDFQKQKEVITKGVNAVVRLIVERGRGHVVTWEEVESLSGFARYSQHWSALMLRLKRDLRKLYGMTVTAVTTIGLRIDTPAEQLHERSVRRLRKARRQVDMDVKELESLPGELLSDHQRVVKVRKIDVSKRTRREVTRTLRDAHEMKKPTSSGMPQRPRPGQMKKCEIV